MPTNSPELPEREREEQAADQRDRKKFRPDDGETAPAMNSPTVAAADFGETAVATPCYGLRARPDRRRS